MLSITGEVQTPATLTIGLISVLSTQCFRLWRMERRHRLKMEEAQTAHRLAVEAAQTTENQYQQHIRHNQRTSSLIAAAPFQAIR